MPLFMMIIVALMFSAMTTTTLEAKETIVVLSDSYPKPVAEQILAQVERMMGTLKQGDRLRIKDGNNARTLADVAIPAGEDGAFLLRNRSAWKRHFRPSYGQVTRHLKEAIAEEDVRATGGVPMQIDLPQVLQELRYDAAAKPNVIIFGDLRRLDPLNPDFSTLAAFPIGDHLNKPPATTPFGALGHEGSLSGVTVHYCATENEYVSQAHRHGVEQANARLITAFGAQLLTISYDLKACVERGLSGASDNAPDVTGPTVGGAMRMVDGDKAAFVTRTTANESLKLLKEINGLDASSAIDLRKRIVKGGIELHAVYVRDTHSEDGDVVTLISGSGSWDVLLRNDETRVIVPVEKGLLRIRGQKDGRGGGITVAFRTDDNSTFRSPVMREGEEITIPFLKSGS